MNAYLGVGVGGRAVRSIGTPPCQDLVAEGTDSHKNLMQLSRTAKNVWLLSATPFPHGNASVFANHEILGFCRLRLDVESETELPPSHPFEVRIRLRLRVRVRL